MTLPEILLLSCAFGAWSWAMWCLGYSATSEEDRNRLRDLRDKAREMVARASHRPTKWPEGTF